MLVRKEVVQAGDRIDLGDPRRTYLDARKTLLHRTCSNKDRPCAKSSRVAMSGGSILTVYSPAPHTSSPAACASLTTCAAVPMTSMPHIYPAPRTPRILFVRLASSLSCAPNHAPFSRTAASSDGSLKRSSTYSATVATKGPPPNVVP